MTWNLKKVKQIYYLKQNFKSTRGEKGVVKHVKWEAEQFLLN